MLIKNVSYKMTAILSVLNKYIKLAIDQNRMIYQCISSNAAILELNANKYTTINNFLQSRLIGFNNDDFNKYWKNINEKKKRKSVKFKSSSKSYNTNNRNINISTPNKRLDDMLRKYKNAVVPMGMNSAVPPGICGFYNTNMGCNGPPKCTYKHECVLCNEPHSLFNCDRFRNNNNT